jgi:hypothetical protein
MIDSRRKVREEVKTEGTDCTIISQLPPHDSAATNTLRASSRLASPCMMVSKLLSNGYVATLPPLK